MRQYKGHDERKLLTSLGLFASLILLSLAFGFMHFKSFFDLLASTVDSLNDATTTLYFLPGSDESIAVGGTTSLDININTKVPINAIGATISFPKDQIEVVGISKEKSFFDLWTEDTSISEDTGEIHFSGGTTHKGGLVGKGTILTLTLRAKNGSSAVLNFKSVQVFPSDATGKPITTDTKTITYDIEPAPQSAPAGGGGGGGGAVIAAAPQVTVPNPDLNGDGKINLIDLSILTIHLIGGYDPRFDLNGDGAINLGDISVLLSRIVSR